MERKTTEACHKRGKRYNSGGMTGFLMIARLCGHGFVSVTLAEVKFPEH